MILEQKDKSRLSWKFSSQILSLLILCTSFLIVVGSCIRMTNSGLSCPDWPFCYGLWLPTYSKISLLPDIDYGFNQVIFEWAHRFLAGFLIGGLMLILLFHLCLQAYRGMGDKSLTFSFILASLLIVVQVILGSFTVFEQNSSWTVALHLLTAVLYLIVLWSLRIQVQLKLLDSSDSDISKRSPQDTLLPRGVGILSFFSVLLLVLIMSVGAMMAKSGASLVCPSWPFCDTFHPMEILEYPKLITDELFLLQLTHRILSFLLLCNNLLLWRVLSKTPRITVFKKLSQWSASLLVLQVLLGGVLIFFAIPFGLNLVHLILSLVILSISSSLYWRYIFSSYS
jgi:cytochrome c oxidase assembly protein subunit 15